MRLLSWMLVGLFVLMAAPVSAQSADVCRQIAPTTLTIVAGDRIFRWCFADAAAGGSPITAWVVYEGVNRFVATADRVTVSEASAGWRLYSLPVTIDPGPPMRVRMAAVNAQGEGPKGPTITVTVRPATKPTAAPTAREVR